MNQPNPPAGANIQVIYVQHFQQGRLYTIRPATMLPYHTGRAIPANALPLDANPTPCGLVYYNYFGNEVTVRVADGVLLRLPTDVYAQEVNHHLLRLNPNADRIVFAEQCNAANHQLVLAQCMLSTIFHPHTPHVIIFSPHNPFATPFSSFSFTLPILCAIH